MKNISKIFDENDERQHPDFEKIDSKNSNLTEKEKSLMRELLALEKKLNDIPQFLQARFMAENIILEYFSECWGGENKNLLQSIENIRINKTDEHNLCYVLNYLREFGNSKSHLEKYIMKNEKTNFTEQNLKAAFLEMHKKFPEFEPKFKSMVWDSIL